MPHMRITFSWMTTTSLAIRTGHAAWAVDAVVRARDGNPEIPGEAVKGAIREAAERLLRWYGKLTVREEGSPWFPPTPQLRRIFACDLAGPPGTPHALYKFNNAVWQPGEDRQTVHKMNVSSTAIRIGAEIAEDETLRSLEYWKKGIHFALSVEGWNGEWSEGTRDFDDLLFLLAAIVSVTAVGGNQGTGSGQVSIDEFAVDVDGTAVLSKPDILQRLSNWLPEAQ